MHQKYLFHTTDGSCALLQMGKLLFPIKKMKGKDAAGPNNIPPLFLKSLGHLVYPYSTHPFHLLNAHSSEELPQSFHY